MDCIAAQENGFTNTVASLGTAFTQDQARLLLRYTNEVVLAFDGMPPVRRLPCGAPATSRNWVAGSTCWIWRMPKIPMSFCD